MSGFIIGLTGGVASGKSELTRRFQALGVHVADADVVARDVVEPGQPALAAIAEQFGSGILQADGRLDRRQLRERIFADPAARRALEAITHPAIRAALEAQCRAAPGLYAIAAIPLLVEAGMPGVEVSGGGGATGTGSRGPAGSAAGILAGVRAVYPWLDRILVVDTPGAVQHARLMRRDGVDETLASRMIAAQASRTTRLSIADDVVVNDGAADHLDTRVTELDALYRTLAATQS